jgi:hypothetical protein
LLDDADESFRAAMNQRAKIQAVREILLCDWDPLGIGDNASLVDEYDSYVPDLLGLLEADASVDQIVRHLETIELKLGGPSLREKRLRAAWRLIDTTRRTKC